MQEKPTSAIKIFYCYAHEDRALRDELDKHLGALKHGGQIITWYDRDIQAGAEWQGEIDLHLYTSDIVLLLVSPDFINSTYCYGYEMRQAFQLKADGKTHIIPIILRPVDWKSTPIGELQVLPRDGKPVTQWRNRDAAFQSVVFDILTVVIVLHAHKEQLRQKYELSYRMLDQKALLVSKHAQYNDRSMLREVARAFGPNKMLRDQREKRGWTQEYLAELVGVPLEVILGWEKSGVLPNAFFRRKLCEVFEKPHEDLGLSRS